MGLATYSARAVSLLSLFIVARYLSPLDFGIAAIALLVGNTLVSLSDFGLSSAVISYGERASAETFARASKYRLAFSLGTFLIVFFAAGPISRSLQAPEAEMALQAMSFALLIGAAAFPPATGLAAQRDFKALSLAYVSLSVAQASVTIALAIILQNYWAIVLGFLAGTSAQAAVQWLRWGNRAWNGSEHASVRALLSVGGLLSVSWISIVILFTLDRIIIVGQFGAQQLGYYALALSCALFVSDSLNLVIGTVALPTFASMDEDRTRIGAAYLASLRLLSFIAVPACIGVIFVAPELLVLAFGAGTDKWLPSLPLLQTLTFVGLFRSIVGPANSVFLATKTYSRFAYLIPIPVGIFLAVAVPLAGALGSAEGVAIGLVLAYFVHAALTLRAVTRLTGIPRWAIIRNLSGPLGGAVAMAAALVPLRLAIPVSWIGMAAIITAGIATYLGAMVLLGRREELMEFVDAARIVLGRKSRQV